MTCATRTQQDEEQLAQRCRNNETEAQTELWHRYYAPVLHAICRCLVRYRASPELDEEIAAVFWSDLLYDKPWRLRAYQPQRGSLQVYLTSLARLAVLDFLAVERRQGVSILPLSDLDRVAPQAEETEVREALEDLLARLSERDRVLLLSYLRRDPGPPETQGGAETTPATECLRQRKKRLVHKLLQILDLRHIPKKSEENGRADVTNRPRNLG